MDYLVQHGQKLLLLGIFPVLGILLEKLLSTKAILYLLVGLFILLSPMLKGYSYSSYSVDMILFLLILACVYTFLSRIIKNKVPKYITALIFSISLVVIYRVFLFLLLFGHEKINEAKLTIDGYQIECIEQRNFISHVLTRYHLNRTSEIPLFKKRIETVVVNEEYLRTCKINFPISSIVVDKCNSSITQNAR
jgi:hypothetical protein